MSGEPEPASRGGPRGYLRQELRLAVGGLYALALVALGFAVTGQIPPPFTTEGLWFYTGFLPLILARFIIEPYFTRPADSLANGLALLVAAATLTPATSALPLEAVSLGRVSIAVLASVSLAVSVVAMLGRDVSSPFFRMGPRASSYAATIGSGEVGFSVYLAFVAAIAFGNAPWIFVLLAAAWVILIFIRPLEWVAAWLPARSHLGPPDSTLVADGLVDPNLVVATSHPDVAVSVGSRVRWASGAAGTVVDRTLIAPHPNVLVSLDQAGQIALRERAQVHAGEPRPVVGYVVEGTSIDELVVRLNPALPSTIEEGRLLVAPIRSRPTLFQVTAARLVERSEAGLRRQLAEIRARKLGVWNAVEHGFDQVPWMSDPGSPTELVEPTRPPDTIGGVGCVPGTSYEIGVKVDDLVTHNTAILGILGVGKTSLAWELITRMVVEGIRVIVLDITGEYATRFSQQFEDGESAWMYAAMEKRLAPSRNNTSIPRETAGNVSSFKPAFSEILRRFTAAPSSLLVVNPSVFDVTTEDGFPASGVVPLRNLTTPEITRLLAEAILEHAQREWPADPSAKPDARVCLVLEEAHSLVPEGGSTSDRNEVGAAAKASRAILQGRKYGVGCLLITQRTANVTKTILNQCHTVFAMRSFDATSEQFLANYLGTDYASLLPNLRERQAVFFGRASTSKSPIIIDLNDRATFKEQWSDESDRVPPTRLSTELSAGVAELSSDDQPDVDRGTTDEAVVDLPDFEDLPF